MVSNIEYISLGGNCSVAYQLHKNNIRHNGYPFDWSKSTMRQLISVLDDKCKEYVSSLEISDFSNSHPYIKIFSSKDNSLLLQTGTYKCKNKYGITMSHELVKQNDFTTLKEKLLRRVERFYNLDTQLETFIDTIIYIRIELKVISLCSYVQYIERLFKHLDIISKGKTYKLKLILYKANIEMSIALNKYIIENKLEIYYYECFTPDWKMGIVDWNKILLDKL